MNTLLVILSLFAISSADFINGGFEQGCTSIYCLGATSLPGWTVTQDNVDIVGTLDWPAHTGTYSIDMDGKPGATGALKQGQCTTIGNTYTVTFWMSYNPDYSFAQGGPTFSLSVQATGSAAATYTVTAPANAPRSQFTQMTYTFVATASFTDVTITSLTPDNIGPVIDDVSIDGDASPAPCASPTLTGDQICQNANQNDWTYGQGYYCVNSHRFVQCWGNNPVYSAEQECAAGTHCWCSSQTMECSFSGQVSPCRSNA